MSLAPDRKFTADEGDRVLLADFGRVLLTFHAPMSWRLPFCLGGMGRLRSRYIHRLSVCPRTNPHTFYVPDASKCAIKLADLKLG